MKIIKSNYLPLKICIDFFLCIILAVALLPFFLAIAIIIKATTSGSIFFTQKRVGKKLTCFKIIKFRTMVVDAENKGDMLFVFSECDKRITKIGKVLRSFSLDEIPQILNILKGDMSLVGPRPPVPYHPYKVSEYPDCFKKKI
jgi:undecaprenyl phosphate N,N'-diacetylbacillosamine 1-phosphate transferase